MAEIIEWINNNDGFFLVLLTAVYVIATIVTIRKMTKSNEIAQNSIEVFTEIENDKNRPVLIFSIELVKKVIVVAKVQNTGPTTAYNISISTEPNLKPFGTDKNIRFLSEVISSLPPGAELSTVLGTYAEYKKEFEDQEISGFIEYSRIGGKTFKERFNFDLTIYEGLSWVTELTMHDNVKELKKIREELSLISNGHKKPVIRVLDEDKYQENQRKIDEEATEQLMKSRKKK